MVTQVMAHSASLLAVVASVLLSGVAPSAGQEIFEQAFRIRPSDVAVPAGVPLGQYRRTTTPFDLWTLICDENLSARQMICNVSQVIVDQTDRTVFSWSLAATEDGQPFMIVRAMPTAQPEGMISLRFPGRAEPVEVAIDGCNETVCAGMVPVGPILREQIDREAEPEISFATMTGESISVTASLKGLATALSSID